MARVALLVVVLGLAAVSAQEAPAPPSSGDATLTGVVRAAGSEGPLRGARVIVTTADGRAAGRTFSDQSGRFEIAIPSDDELVVSASKAGYAPERAPLDVGQRSLEIRLATGGVLRGRAIQAAGHLLVDATVEARFMGDSPDAGVVATAVTDDLGEYRIGSLPAGRYEVRLATAGSYVIENPLSPSPSPSVVVTINGGNGSPAPASGKPSGVPVDVQGGRETVQDLVGGSPGAARARSYATSFRGAADNAVRRTGRTGDARDARTGVVGGRVLDQTGRPLEWAVVQLIPGDVDGGPWIATSDGDGRYEIVSVPDGRYRLAVRMPGMMATEYGAGAGSRRGQWIEIREGRRLQDVDLTPPRGAVISGTVLDQYGEPLEGTTVHAWRSERRDGRILLRPASGVRSRTTDDRGSYRLHGLASGAYYVVVSDDVHSAGPGAAQSSVSGTAAAADSPAGAFVTAAPLAYDSSLRSPVLYYPGRPSIGEASAVHVDAGIDAFGVDVSFTPPVAARVTGVATDSSGGPVTGEVTLTVSRRSGAPVPPPLSVSTDAQGTFEFPAAAPGDYVVQVLRQRIRMQRTTVRTSDGGRIESERVQASTEFATAFVAVTGSDVGPIQLRTTSGSTMSGRLVLEGRGESPIPALFRLGVATADPDYGPPLQRMTVSFDGSQRFETSGLVGPVRFVPAAVPEGWWLKSVLIDGVNAVNDPVTFGSPAQSKRDVEVVFSNAITGISGRVLDDRREPALGASVVVFPVDWTRWFERSPYLRIGATGSGQFSVTAIPPGDYYVAAVESLEELSGALPNTSVLTADVFNTLIPQSTSVTVREGQPATTEVTVARLPR